MPRDQRSDRKIEGSNEDRSSSLPAGSGGVDRPIVSPPLPIERDSPALAVGSGEAKRPTVPTRLPWPGLANRPSQQPPPRHRARVEPWPGFDAPHT